MITREAIEEQLTRKPEVILVTPEVYDQAKQMLELDDHTFMLQLIDLKINTLKPLLDKVDKFISEQSELVKAFTEEEPEDIEGAENDEDLSRTEDEFTRFIEEARPNQAKSYIAQLKLAISIHTTIMMAFSKMTRSDHDRKTVEEDSALYVQAASGMIILLRNLYDTILSCDAIIKHTLDTVGADSEEERVARVQKIVTAIADAVSEWTREEIKNQGKEEIDSAVVDAVNDRICNELDIEKDLVMLQLDPDSEDPDNPQYAFAFSYEDATAFEAIYSWYYMNEIEKFANNIGVDVV